MLENEIQALQNELNQLLEVNEDYSKVYELSVKLDRLIVQYYKRENN